MAFKWLKQFHHANKKPEDYAEKTLAAYARGMKAGGSIRGIRIEVGEGSCQAALELPPDALYLPGDAPRLPLPGCLLGRDCTCIYRPVMNYEDRETAR
jgi:hypothetical protein